MKLTQIDLPAPEGQREIAGWISTSELFPMQSLRRSMGTIKGVPRSDGHDTKSVSGVTNGSVYGWDVKYEHKTFLSAVVTNQKQVIRGLLTNKKKAFGNDHMGNTSNTGESLHFTQHLNRKLSYVFLQSAVSVITR